MSFSTQVKSELCGIISPARHCRIAETAAIINTCGQITTDDFSVRVQTENASVAKKYFLLIKKTFNINCSVSIRVNRQFKKNHLYSILVNDSAAAQKLLSVIGLIQRGEDGEIFAQHRINPLIIQSDCCKRAYIRGSFIASGSLSEPEKTYHMEFVNGSVNICEQLSLLINSYELNSKIIRRKGHYIVYLKEGEHIVDLLNIMGAHTSLMNLENLRIIKDMRNNVNRICNCETANLNKTVNAAVKQLEDIEYIAGTRGLQYLSPQLEEVAVVRMQYSDATLKEIGERLDPPVGKSGVNHRLRKISEIAEQLRGTR